MIGWLWVSARAQDVLLDDFDGGGSLEWTDTSPIHSGIPVPTGYFYIDDPVSYFGAPHDGLAGICEPAHGMGGYCEAVSSPFLVTHTSLSVAMWTDELGSYVGAEVVRTGRYIDSVSADAAFVWQDQLVDLSSACSREASVYWHAFAESYGLNGIDDLALTGALCPGYVDGDGDGLCPTGTDLDGDGTCIDAGEAVSADTVIDCDDTAAGTDCLSLVVAPPIRGERMEVVVTGASPGERIGLVASQTLAEICPLRLGGLCLEVGAPLVARRAVADASGTARATFAVPVDAAIGSRVYVQAWAIRGIGGADSVKSNLASEVVRP